MTGKAPNQNAGAQMLYRSAIEALSAGRFEEGIALLEKVLAVAPPNGDIHNNLGTAHWKCGRLDKAEAHYAKAVRLAPDNPIAQNNYGGLLMEMSRLDEAEKHIRRAHQLKPDHPSIANHMGLVQCRRGDLSGAENSFRRAIAIRPDWSDAHANLGNVYRDLKRQPEAEACYRRALALDPKNANAWRDLGALFFSTLNHAEAEDALRKALALRPNSENAWNLLLQLLEMSNRLEETGETLKQAQALFPESPSIAAIKARLLRREGKLAEAAAEMERLLPTVKDTTESILFLFELGQIYDRMNEADKAFDAFRRANDAQAKRPEAMIFDKQAYPRIAARLTAQVRPAILPPPVPDDRAPPVFLVGFPRSGTTLLDQILSSHPGVFVAEEKPGVAVMGEYFARKFGTTLKPGAPPQTGTDIWDDACYPEAIAKLSADDIAEMRRLFWRAHGADAGLNGRMFVDKMPVNLMHAAFIHAVFPTSKFILALRHPCDCVLSCFMQAFDLNAAMARFLDLKDGARFYDEMFGVWEHTRQALPLDVHAIRYEDVVTDFRPAVESLLSFLGLPWSDAVLEYDKTAKTKDRINTPSYHQVTQKIYTRASGRWVRYAKHMAPVADLLKPHAERYGYSMKTGE